MGDNIEGLTARELLKNTYSVLSERYNPEEIVLPNMALLENVNVPGGHRTRVGYMVYKNAGLFQFNKKHWAIVRGERCASYIGRQYDCDLIALELEDTQKTTKQRQIELEKKIIESSYFVNSLVFVMDNGELSLLKNGRFGEKMLDKLRPEIQRFIAQEPKYDRSSVLTSTLQHPKIRNMFYKPELADFLADSIKEVLT